MSGNSANYKPETGKGRILGDGGSWWKSAGMVLVVFSLFEVLGLISWNSALQGIITFAFCVLLVRFAWVFFSDYVDRYEAKHPGRIFLSMVVILGITIVLDTGAWIVHQVTPSRHYSSNSASRYGHDVDRAREDYLDSERDELDRARDRRVHDDLHYRIMHGMPDASGHPIPNPLMP